MFLHPATTTGTAATTAAATDTDNGIRCKRYTYYITEGAVDVVSVTSCLFGAHSIDGTVSKHEPRPLVLLCGVSSDVVFIFRCFQEWINKTFFVTSNYHERLNVPRMRDALSLLVGWHDFTHFGGVCSTEGGKSGLRCVVVSVAFDNNSFSWQQFFFLATIFFPDGNMVVFFSCQNITIFLIKYFLFPGNIVIIFLSMFFNMIVLFPGNIVFRKRPS